MEDSKREMLEKITNKMNLKVEEILSKDEIDYNDFMILSTKLTDLKNDIANERITKFSEVLAQTK